MMQEYDLHVHTDASSDAGSSPEQVVEAAVSCGLDGIAVTDHDTMEKVGEVEEAAPGELEVVPGVEVSTKEGHILALGVDEVPGSTDPLEAVEEVHLQGGVAVLAHPFDGLRQRFGSSLEELASVVDGVEILNSRCLLPRFNRQAEEFSENLDVAVTGGSDAHFPFEVGRARTLAEGGILEALRERETSVSGSDGYTSGHFATKLHEFRNLF